MEHPLHPPGHVWIRPDVHKEIVLQQDPLEGFGGSTVVCPHVGKARCGVLYDIVGNRDVFHDVP